MTPTLFHWESQSGCHAETKTGRRHIACVRGADHHALLFVRERRRVRGVPCIFVADDGEGVIPEMSREEALHYLATHVGHSRKLGLTPAERHQRVVAEKYGVDLLGFWSIGDQYSAQSLAKPAALCRVMQGDLRWRIRVRYTNGSRHCPVLGGTSFHAPMPNR